jgi:hypothetical protein
VLRAAAVRGLGRCRSRAHAEVVAGFLRDPDLDVRREAIRALAWIGDDRHVAALRPFLGDVGLRDETMWALARLGDCEVVPYARRRLDDPETATRSAAVRTLAVLGIRAWSWILLTGEVAWDLNGAAAPSMFSRARTSWLSAHEWKGELRDLAGAWSRETGVTIEADHAAPVSLLLPPAHRTLEDALIASARAAGGIFVMEEDRIRFVPNSVASDSKYWREWARRMKME